MLPECLLNTQHFMDVRDITEDLLQDVDAIVHLAAVSNDPMGNAFEEVTMEINHRATIALASKAKTAGVGHFVFASSCSVYGFAEGGPRTEEAELNPLTAYARSKVYSERDLEALADDNFVVTCLRFATACGMSDRLRLDLVLNDFVSSAVVSGKIDILSDGTPWRPLITVQDMARAIDWAVLRNPANGGQYLAVNAGSNDWNYQVKDLANAVASIISGTRISINKNAAPDKRSYQVDFSKFGSLAPDYQARVDLNAAISGLKEGLESNGIRDKDFRNSKYMRLKVLSSLCADGFLNNRLKWVR
jgi:nucleoside-diphosphate-sugar epimerase